MNDSPLQTYGPAKRPDRLVEHERPAGMDDETVAALGKVSEALETVELARGFLYAFHRLSGTADRTLSEGVEQLRSAGHAELADELETVLVGRDVIEGMWTFQVVESYDANYYAAFRDTERWLRRQCGDAEPHIFEAEMKHREQGGE